jgi:hypothetical protein
VANGVTIPVAGRVTYVATINGRACRFCDVLHVPDLDLPLLSVRRHRRRTPGCSFISDFSGCFFAFLSFVVEVDDSIECLVDF